MLGVILAAGDGGRLRPYTDHTPKVLIPMKNRPLIWYPMSAMAQAGITRIGVVVGHKAEQVVEGVFEWAPSGVQVEFIYNPEFDGGNAVSLRAAREFVGSEMFMLSMGDHVIDSSVAACLARSYSPSALLGVDSAATAESQLSDATKVQLDKNGYLVNIGKGLKQWNAVDIGVFKFRPSVFDAIEALYETNGADLELGQLMQYLADQPEGVATCDIRGLFWSDIDTADDYRNAETLISS